MFPIWLPVMVILIYLCEDAVNMKNLIKRYLFAGLYVSVFHAVFFSIGAFAAEILDIKYQGNWSVSCSKPTDLKFKSDNKAILSVRQNQIYIEIKYKKNNNNALDLFYEQPFDLGLGGSAIDWDEISTSEKIGSFKLTDEKIGVLSWRGFLDKKTGKHILVEDSDFSNQNNEIVLIRCK